MSKEKSTTQKITLKESDIESAEKVLGVEYTQTERLQMVNNLEG